MKYIPKDTILHCPCCKTELYKIDADMYPQVGGLSHLIPYENQKQLIWGDCHFQPCHKCNGIVNIKKLIDEHF